MADSRGRGNRYSYSVDDHSLGAANDLDFFRSNLYRMKASYHGMSQHRMILLFLLHMTTDFRPNYWQTQWDNYFGSATLYHKVLLFCLLSQATNCKRSKEFRSSSRTYLEHLSNPKQRHLPVLALALAPMGSKHSETSIFRRETSGQQAESMLAVAADFAEIYARSYNRDGLCPRQCHILH